MIKLQGSYNKIITIFIVISFFSFPSFSWAGETSNVQLEDAVAISLQENSEISDENPFFSHKREQKSRQDLEVLLGAWDFSYSIGETSYTSKVEFSKVVFVGKNEMVTGLIFRDESGVGEQIGCIEQDVPLINRTLNTNYQCGTDGSVLPLLTFAFKVIDNNITNGIFSSGETIDEAGNNLAISSSPFMVFSKDRTNSSVNGNRLEAFYFLIEDELDIPVVNYQGFNYRVILKNEGDFIFSIKHVLPTSLIIEGDQPVYNESNNELIIPVVKYDDSKYRIKLENKGNFLFSIRDAQSL